jgi:hypothetical protein
MKGEADEMVKRSFFFNLKQFLQFFFLNLFFFNKNPMPRQRGVDDGWT